MSTDDKGSVQRSNLVLVAVEEENGDENKERGNWGSQIDFILSCVGYAVGLGNVWRFPYLCYKNGGGAFLIPYAIMLAFAGLPIFLLELSFGQYSSRGPIQCWNAIPMMRGVGIGMMLVSAYVGISYNVIITYTIYYMFASFTKSLPWIGCDHSWNTDMCSDLFDNCLSGGGIINDSNVCVPIANMTHSERDYYNVSLPDDVSNYRDPFEKQRSRPSEEYWERQVLQRSSDITETGHIVWQLALCMLFAWFIVFCCLFKGIKSSGKVVYFTATFPYVVLFILLIRGVTLPGYYDGVLFFITPNWETLSKPQVWLDAAVQIFYSLSASWGGLITLASYNRFHNNCYRDTLIVANLNCLTSVFAGFVIFSIIGFMANELGRPVGEVVDQGFGLAFIAYPEAVARLPVSPLWSFLFFFMLLTLGLDSQFTICETVCTAIVDQFPSEWGKKYKTFVMLGMCIFGYLLALPCVTQAGFYWAELIDSYAASFALLIYGLSEVISIGWIYGVKRFLNDIRTMIGSSWVDFPLFLWWPLNWCAITPGILTFILMFNFINWQEPGVGEQAVWARAIGWLIIITAIMWIPIFWVIEFVKAEGSLVDRWKAMSSPTASWGPALQHHRQEAWEMHKRGGTTMGGKLELPKKSKAASEPAVRYTPSPATEGGANPGFEENEKV
ncbi:sodium- and chloride-dependent glycine transporter 1-like [Ptychodera flava]|uniref:sodium- and chloride-dependent glycine transporter 1-like n=1 Tax=Ptychodera flava TaxID=63121 RepID=UPI003969C4A2